MSALTADERKEVETLLAFVERMMPKTIEDRQKFEKNFNLRNGLQKFLDMEKP